MPEPAGQSDKPAPDQNWNQALPEIISEPTPRPAALALGVTLILWGFASSLLITAVGGGLFFISLAFWIRDIRHERGAR